MISDEEVKQLFLRAMSTLARNMSPGEVLDTQFYRGAGTKHWSNQHPGGCTRHMSVFEKYNIIPRYCFDCYKVVVKPVTVVELLKLMVLFEKLNLPRDNTRKCLVECRERISGTYTGMVYCQGIEDGKEVMRMLQRILAEEISKNIPVTLKRGCSEYALSYPEYAKVKQGTSTMMYREEWQEYEKAFDIELDLRTLPALNETNNRPTFTLQDGKVMLAWLRYAATIGDRSYLEISGQPLPPLQGLHRPHSF